jgi:hypothetical protein
MSQTSHSKLRPTAATVVGWLILLLQSLSHGSAPPADGILDETRALSTETHRQLAAELRQFREDLRCDAWITATSFVPAEITLRRQAQITRREWSGERPAVLMAYDRATNSGAMSFAPELWARHSSAELIEIMQESRRTLGNTALTLDERLALATRSWIDRLRRMESARLRHTLPLQNDEKLLARAVIAVLAGGGVVLALFGLASRRRSASSKCRFEFPEVHVDMRLGAPYGGGVSAEMTPGH